MKEEGIRKKEFVRFIYGDSDPIHSARATLRAVGVLTLPREDNQKGHNNIVPLL